MCVTMTGNQEPVSCDITDQVSMSLLVGGPIVMTFSPDIQQHQKTFLDPLCCWSLKSESVHLLGFRCVFPQAHSMGADAVSTRVAEAMKDAHQKSSAVRFSRCQRMHESTTMPHLAALHI